MKKLLSLFLVLSMLCFAVNAYAISGSVSLANIRLSLDPAFVDFSAAGTLPLNHRLKICDSAGKCIVGFTRAAGTGETLSETELVGWTNNAGNPYETLTVNANAKDLDSVINTTGYGIAYNTIATASEKLFKLTFNLTLTSGAAPKYTTGSTVNMVNELTVVPNISIVGNTIAYYVGRYATEYSGFATGNGVAVNFSTTGTSIKQVLTPSATGVTIVSTPGGATYNWNIETGFNYNDASGYTYKLFPLVRQSRFYRPFRR